MTAAADPTVRVAHIRACGYCMKGARAWFAHYGLDWQAFVAEGLPASRFEATGDHLGMTVAARARESSNG